MKENLEAILAKVNRLGQDLSAEIVHQEEEGHMEQEEYYPPGHSRYGTCDSYEVRDVWAVTQERIAEPDTEKRRNAEKELTELFEGGSHWYSVRYLAGQYLMVNEGYSLGRRLHEENRLAVFFAQSFQFLMQTKNEDESKRLKQDFDALYSMVSPKHVRKEMCRIIGYSTLRFIAMEYPLAVTAACTTVAVGTVSGVVYGLMEYFGGS